MRPAPHPTPLGPLGQLLWRALQRLPCTHARLQEYGQRVRIEYTVDSNAPEGWRHEQGHISKDMIQARHGAKGGVGPGSGGAGALGLGHGACWRLVSL